MKIEIVQSCDGFRADCLDLPGTPPVGIGSTPIEAVESLFRRMSTNELPGGRNWWGYIDGAVTPYGLVQR